MITFHTMVCKHPLGALLLVCVQPASGQNQNGVWIFNNTMGVDFMTAPPTILTDYTGFWGNTAVICDENGDLLLYSDDTRILNGQDQVLVNGDGLFNSTVTNTLQSSTILPWPGHPGEYYMIQPYPWNPNDPDARTFYHRIDMNAGGGIGEVMEKNIVLADSAGAYVTAVLDSTGTGIWVILHHLNAPQFMAYHLDASGLSTTPVISEAGPYIEPSWYQSIGILRPSPNGERLYLSKCYLDCVSNTSLHQMDLNKATGEITTFNTFDAEIPSVHGLEISPSGQFLYATTRACSAGVATRLWQYDVSSGDPAIINDSKTLLYEGPITPGGCMGMQGNLALGVDGRIYCGVSNAQYLGVINEPDLPAPACEYVHEGLYLDGDSSWLWLPNQMREYPITNTGISSSQGDQDRLIVRPNPAGESCRITWPGKDVRSLVLVDATGRRVREVMCTSGQSEVHIDRGGLPGGIYQAIARNASGGAISTGRVVFE